MLKKGKGGKTGSALALEMRGFFQVQTSKQKIGLKREKKEKRKRERATIVGTDNTENEIHVGMPRRFDSTERRGPKRGEGGEGKKRAGRRESPIVW